MIPVRSQDLNFGIETRELSTVSDLIILISWQILIAEDFEELGDQAFLMSVHFGNSKEKIELFRHGYYAIVKRKTQGSFYPLRLGLTLIRNRPSVRQKRSTHGTS